MATPGPGFARRDKADFRHQVANGRFVEPKTCDERSVYWILAAMLPDMMGVRSEPVGEVDAQPFGSEAAEGQSSATRIGGTVKRSS